MFYGVLTLETRSFVMGKQSVCKRTLSLFFYLTDFTHETCS